MQKVLIEDLVEQKILPFSIFNEAGEKLFASGDVLTPGKLMELKQIPDIYTDVEDYKQKLAEAKEAPKQEALADMINENGDNQSQAVTDEDEQEETENEEVIYTLDDVDIGSVKGALNRKAKIDPELQLKIKAFHVYTQNSIKTKKVSELAQMYTHLKDRIISDIIMHSDEFNCYSELRIMGDYKDCHALNVAILSGFLAYKMQVKESILSDVILGALMHDIGKVKIPESILEQQILTDKEQKVIQTHTKIGYQLLKEEFKVSENIARVALEHHENSNGSGYPYGKSGDFISKESCIVSVCNHFDNLISNVTNQKIHNCHEACKIMLELGSRRFSADALYTFIHMLSYNDIDYLEELSI
ncbi:MAG: HD domain-containing protein [Candidatus Gastranaerophilales bacterium]|nr:HD domain-containing protein [Candidatus Gastranaerophilales bacterium]